MVEAMQLLMTQPDDFHVHLRDENSLKDTVKTCSRQFARALVMPNLTPPVCEIQDALAYRKRILNVLSPKTDFQPLMSLYLTENTTENLIEELQKHPEIYAFKLYPKGATTHSEYGVADLKKLYHLFSKMEQFDIPLLIHGEAIDADIDIFDREKIFIDRDLTKLIETFPKLRIVLEHTSTAYAIEFIKQCSEYVAATITIHHLLFNRNDLLQGGIHPHYYCLPILKTKSDQNSLIEAAISGNPKFFLGTDSAPHARNKKESACGCAGIYSAPVAIEMYATLFEQMNALDQLENFASIFGANFYKLPINQNKILLEKTRWEIPQTMPLGNSEVVPMGAGTELNWQLKTIIQSKTP